MLDEREKVTWAPAKTVVASVPDKYRAFLQRAAVRFPLVEHMALMPHG